MLGLITSNVFQKTQSYDLVGNVYVLTFCLLFGSCIGLLKFGITNHFCYSVVKLKHSSSYTLHHRKLKPVGFESHTLFPPRHASVIKKHIVYLIS